MGISKKAVTFGSASGLLWGFVPLNIADLRGPNGETATVFIASILTGIIISLMLSKTSKPTKKSEVFGLGFITVPAGGFLFGVLASSIQFCAQRATGHTYRFVENGFDPLSAGLGYAMYGFYIFGLLLVPLAIATTSLLFKFLSYGLSEDSFRHTSRNHNSE